MVHRIKELALLVYGDWSVVPGTYRKAERANSTRQNLVFLAVLAWVVSCNLTEALVLKTQYAHI